MRRRLFLAGLGTALAAPAIVRASSLMPIVVPRPSFGWVRFSSFQCYDTDVMLDIVPWAIWVDDSVKQEGSSIVLGTARGLLLLQSAAQREERRVEQAWLDALRGPGR